GPGGYLGVTSGGVEVAVRAEGQLPAVVDGGVRDAGQDRLRFLAQLEPDDPVVGGGAVVGEDPAVGFVIGRDRDAQQPTLASGVHPLDGLHQLHLVTT